MRVHSRSHSVGAKAHAASLGQARLFTTFTLAASSLGLAFLVWLKRSKKRCARGASDVNAALPFQFRFYRQARGVFQSLFSFGRMRKARVLKRAFPINNILPVGLEPTTYGS